MPDIDVAGHRVSYQEAGTGPTVILAHCSLAYGGLWKGVMAALADRWHCVALDLPGHGQTDRGDEALSLQHQAVAYVEALTTAMGAPAHMVGLSLGGAVMGRVASRSPALTRSLTLIEPVYFHLIADQPAHMAANASAMGPVHQACNEGRYHDGARAFMDAWGQPGQFDRMPKPAQDSIARSLGFLSADFDMVSEWPEGQITREDITAIPARTLLMQGERTPGSAKAILDAVEMLKPDAERFEVPGAGHLSPVDDPEAVAARLRQFFVS
ncbi:MAG: alpha/beta hydrolase [Pseudomonadota bacterium]